jgi:hopanoid biosynthesis associated protein HpnK
MAARLIINADDFGLCSGVNRAVERAHREGVLTSATIMAGAPAAEEAVELAAQMPELGVGIHLNLLEGAAISKDKRIGVLLNEKGEFAHSVYKLSVMSLLSRHVREAIKIELASQIQWVLDRGIKATHLDSHKHIHIFCSILPIVASLAVDSGIGAIRWPFEPGSICSPAWPEVGAGSKLRAFVIRNMAKRVYSKGRCFFKNTALFGIKHTGRIDGEFWRALLKNGFEGTVEVMTHPGYTEGLDPAKTRLVEQRQVELEAMCSDELKEAFTEADIELTHYGKL